jgi:streptomycin 6-kinase
VGDPIAAVAAAECARRWGLSVGEPYPQGAAGYAVRAQLPDGTPAVLKLIHPHRESEHEADALALWDGSGAVRLLDRDDERGAT